MAAKDDTDRVLISRKSARIMEQPLKNHVERNAPERQRFLSPSASGEEDGITLSTRDDAEEGASSSRNDVTLLAKLENDVPSDRFNAVYVIMVVHGVGLLMSWNMFINAKQYYEDHKLQPPVNQTSSAALSDYRTNFMTYIGMACQIPGTIMSLLNLFVQCGGKAKVRIILSIVIIIVVFVITIILAMVDSSKWPEEFFWFTLISAVISSSASGVYQNSLMGVVAMLPMKYTNAVIFGNNISGTFVALLNIVMIAVAPDTKSSAMYYFTIAVVVLLIALDSYFALPHTKFFRHFQSVMKLKQQLHQDSTESEGGQTCLGRLRSYFEVFKQIWVLALSVWFVFFVTLALFPQIQSDIRKSTTSTISISEKYWAPVFCFLSFNVFAMLGNILSEIVHFPSARWVWVPVVGRVAFIPLYLMFNFRGTGLWDSDAAFITTSILMALSAGYLSSLCMMYGPTKVAKKDAGTAGMMMAFFLVLGISSGVNAARLLVLVEW